MANRVGQRFGDYRLIRFLGQGTFGDVYVGEHIYDKTYAAVKVLKTQLTPDRLKDFINEVRTFRLKHPNIVQLLDFGIGDDDIPFLVMDYAPNGSLRDRHPKGARLPLETIIGYVNQIAAALQYAHDHRLIHRDVKPENMLLDANNQVLLSDFGIAVAAHGTGSLSLQEAIGTISYMAPEQFQGQARPASDQYALGVIVYEWLCGERPFKGTAIEVGMQHSLATPPPLHDKLPTISPEVEQVVMTALAKDPRQRFKSVQAFANALEQAYGPKPAIGTTLLVYRGHSAGTNAVAWSPDGREIASCSFDGAVNIWDAVVGANICTCQGHSGPVNAVVWSPDGRRIAFGSWDKTVQIWDVTTGSRILTYQGHSSNVKTVAWSPDGKRITSAGGKAFGVGHNDRTVQVWDAMKGSTILTYQGHSGLVAGVAWSPDGRNIASGSWDNTVQIWDATTGANIYTYRGHSGRVLTIAWSPDGRRIASDADNMVQIWDAMTGARVCTYQGRSHFVETVAWSPDSKYIASCSLDGTMQIWNATTGANVYTYHSQYGTNTLAWSPDGTRIASAGDGVQIWQAV